jgi:hypothetical protein
LLSVYRLKEKSPSMLWNDDLDEFLENLDVVEQKEIADAAEGTDGKKAAKGKKKTFKQETMASPNGIRVAVKVSFSTKRENHLLQPDFSSFIKRTTKNGKQGY